ncbi:MAG: NADP-dependent oxidoreductase [Nevskia sp.]
MGGAPAGPHAKPAKPRGRRAPRPAGAPAASDFLVDEAEIPVPGAGEMLLRTRYLSIDPYMRGRMNAAKSYAEPVALGAVMCGATISRVKVSNLPGYAPGELVLANAGWQDWALSDGREVMKLDPALAQPSWALGVLGMPGFTAWLGLLDIGQPKAGETVVVAAATGAVGSLVGQIAKLRGCRVVGVAGGTEKCAYAVEELGFDACINHHEERFGPELAKACPDGIDIYFENVGGAVFETVLSLLNVNARIPLCGLIAWANLASLPTGYDMTPRIMRTLLTRRVRLQGFIIFDHYERRHAAFYAEMSGWLREGRIKVREDFIDGLIHAPGALAGLLRGDNFGKLVIRVERD